MAGVSAAEKYAELEARGEERPLCECHGETQFWCKQKDSIMGGCWRCAVHHRKIVSDYQAKYPEKKREYESHRVYIHGQLFRAPDQDFKQFAIELREQRREDGRKKAA